MNCIGVEKLLPLYVEDDMTEDESARVRAHLSSCEGCRQLLEEFRASQERLHNFAAPDFGAEFYEQLRGAVLTEITARKEAAPSLIEQLRSFLVWRPALAVSFALLVILCGAISYSLYNSLQRSDAALASLEKSRRDFNLEIKEAENPAVNASTEGDSRTRQQAVATASNSVRRPRNDGQPKALPESPAPEKNDAATASTNATVAASNAAQPSPKEENETAEPRQAIARMDIQTSDPNIRIIWLAPKKGE